MTVYDTPTYDANGNITALSDPTTFRWQPSDGTLYIQRGTGTAVPALANIQSLKFISVPDMSSGSPDYSYVTINMQISYGDLVGTNNAATTYNIVTSCVAPAIVQ
jgi:hypothetical protein